MTMNKSCVSVAAVLMTACFLFKPATVHAAECVHGPIVLPGLSGPPVWLGPAGATTWRPELNDPRWASASIQLFGNSSTGVGGIDDAQYRVLYAGGKLYVSIQVLADDITDSTDLADAVYLG